MNQVKIFSSLTTEDVEVAVNEWIGENVQHLILSLVPAMSGNHFTMTIIYENEYEVEDENAELEDDDKDNEDED